MHIITINPNITAFYYGAETQAPSLSANYTRSQDDWVYGACFDLGVASYALHNKNSCIIFDTLCSPEQAREAKEYLEQHLGIKKFTVIVSHWHLHHIGGNYLYKDFNIIGTRKTRQILLEQKEKIESGTSSWGPPAIEQVLAPNIVFDDELSLFLDDLEVRLYNINIHSEDSLCAYLPRYKALLPGDMLEDPIPFITDPQTIAQQVRNYDLLRKMDIDLILPNHCRLSTLSKGGYAKDLIESSAFYLHTLNQMLRTNPGADIPNLKTLMQDYFSANTISYWPAYEHVHLKNIEKVKICCSINSL